MLDPNHFRRLLSNPETTVEEDLESLELLLEEYPYLQSARALQLKMYKQKNSELYNEALRKTAAHTTDRDVLFKFITSEIFKEDTTDATSKQNPEHEKDTVQDTAKTEQPLEQVEEQKEEIAHDTAKTEQPIIQVGEQKEEIAHDAAKTEQPIIQVEEQKEEVILDPVDTTQPLIEIEEVKQVNNDMEATQIASEIDNVEEVEQEESPENVLELDKPISFNKEDSYSFSKWMQLTRLEPINRDEKQKSDQKTAGEEGNIALEEDSHEQAEEEFLEPKEEKTIRSTDKVIHLVDEFLKNNPRPSRTPSFLDPEENIEASQQKQASQSLMTETLARVYLQQKNYTKAIQAYKILILKNPEKSGYFADKIRAIEKLTNKK